MESSCRLSSVVIERGFGRAGRLLMNKLEIPHDAFVFVGDGRKALFLRNAGDERFPNFRAERVTVDDNPPTHEQGSDRPGRAFKRAGTNLRSGVEDTDWHELEQHRFVHRVAETMERLVRERKVKATRRRCAATDARGSASCVPLGCEESDHCRNRQGPDQASST
jgi:protein required for attachment to host cells